MDTTTKNADETKELGKKIASDLKGGKVFALVGDLGSGKTTFVQGFAEGLEIKQRIVSPTFILMRKYEVPLEFQVSRIKSLYHLDLYRLEGNVEEQLQDLGFNEIINDLGNVVIIEWADKANDIYPKNTVRIEFESLEGDKRKINIKT